jgi:hypothetical protein
MVVEAATADLELGHVDSTDSNKIILHIPGAGLSFTAQVKGVELCGSSTRMCPYTPASTLWSRVCSTPRT